MNAWKATPAHSRRRRRIRIALGVFASAMLNLSATGSAQAAELRVAVAANFAVPAQKIAADFEQVTGHKVVMSSGSTGKLYSQIKAGAPYDVLLSADDETPRKLVADGTAIGETQVTYAVGRLVLWSARSGVVDDKAEVLKSGRFTHLAIANPKLSPYGRAAEEVLRSLGLLDAVASKLVVGDSIAQAHQFVSTGNADLGFVALSQVFKDGGVKEGSAWIVPSVLHQPIRQDGVVLVNARDKDVARQWLRWLRGGAARDATLSYGYELGEPRAQSREP